ncbi:MAG: CRTAC1 family protein, partial [Bacteroidia bacterium]|nr:CRTAC1 family protein [Bacteroidia bacterium]
DGWLDMYLGTGNPDLKSLVPNRLFKNIGGQKFADVTYSSRTGNLQKGHGVSFADIDNDGDLDIFQEVGGAVKGDAYFNSLYINSGQDDNNFIGLLLEGVASNRSAIGARISVSFIDSGVSRTVFQNVNSGGSFGASPLRQEIGIGKAKMVDQITIKWPNTKNLTVLKNLERNVFIKITEGKNTVERINLQPLKFKITHTTMDNM